MILSSACVRSCGRIELIIGPMFAGKTTELMRRLRREIFGQRACYVIKYRKDVRYSVNEVASHDKQLLPATSAVSKLAECGENWRQYPVIGIDEGQFFPDLVPFCRTAADAGKLVVVSALDGDYKRNPFGSVCELIPLCESVDKLEAVCMMCHEQPASYTRRIVSNTEQELIGGADKYIATCRRCFLQEDPTPEALQAHREKVLELTSTIVNPKAISKRMPESKHPKRLTSERSSTPHP